jgi:hypothetical protein
LTHATDPKEIAVADALAAGVKGGDAFLPAETETIAMTVPGPDGEPVTAEALPPGGQIVVRLVPR